MLYYLLFLFVAMGAKLLLALVTIYLLFPSDRSCNSCNHETLLLQMGRPGRILAWLLLGRIERRWCPRCGWEGFARTHRRTLRGVRTAEDTSAPQRQWID